MAIKNEIGKAFNKHAAEYEFAAKIQQEIGRRLLERLQYLKISPRFILDLGCGPGIFSNELSRLYPNATVIALDLAHDMLIEAKKKQTQQQWSLVASDMLKMPFADGTFDLIFANQTIHWGGALDQVFRELNRVMNVNACLMFTTSGPDSFQELKWAWYEADQFAHINDFVDMHDVGDFLLAEHFLDPVMDMELISVHYQSLQDLLHALKAQGVKNINSQRNKGLTGKKAWQIFENRFRELQTENGKYPLTYEVVYGHAWKGEQCSTEHGVETRIPIERLFRR